eukprot:2598686-Lingulodinium_polyedra.AAC.1
MSPRWLSLKPRTVSRARMARTGLAISVVRPPSRGSLVMSTVGCSHLNFVTHLASMTLRAPW